MMDRFGTWLIGVAVATAAAALIGVMIFGCSYYYQYTVNSDGYYKIIGEGFSISFPTAFAWSALGCIGLWTIGYIGWALQEDW